VAMGVELAGRTQKTTEDISWEGGACAEGHEASATPNGRGFKNP
jgi:hypothetical protein